MADYRVTVRETSRVTASDGDVTELTSLSPGCLRESADGLLLTYTDTTEGGKVFNRIEIKDDSVSVRRTGAVSMALTFCVGQSERTVYGVPPFTFDMTGYKTEAVLSPYHTAKTGGKVFRHHLSSKFRCNPRHIQVVFIPVECTCGIDEGTTLRQSRPHICHNPSLPGLAQSHIVH